MSKTGIIQKAVAVFISIALVIPALAVPVAFAETDPFPDVYESNRNFAAIKTLKDQDLVKGYPDGSFNPEEPVTRAEFATMVCRAMWKNDGLGDVSSQYASRSTFSDVAANDWYTGYINYSKDNGIIDGVGDGYFAPDDNVTYAQAIKLVVCALGYTNIESSDPWYANYLAKGTELGIGVDVEDQFDPDDVFADRGELAQMIYNGNFVDNGVSISVDSDEETFNKENQPFSSNGCLLVPVDFFTDHLNCKVEDKGSTVYTIERNKIKRSFAIGQTEVKMENPYSGAYELSGRFDAAPVMKNGVLYLPAGDIISDAFGLKYDEDFYSIAIDTSITLVPKPTAPGPFIDTSSYSAYLYADYAYTIMYTTDGKTPTMNSTKYDSNGIYITRDTTVKAIAVNEYGSNSEVATFEYKIGGAPTSITLNTTFKEMDVGSAYTLRATIEPRDAVETGVKWKSSDSSIAAVTSSGKVTARKQGTTYIYATSDYDEDIQARCEIKVVPAEIVVDVVPSTLSLDLSKKTSSKLKAEVYNANDESVTWTSNNTRVARVDYDGTVTALSEGEATITAASKYDTSKTGICRVTVSLVNAVKVVVSPKTVTLSGTTTTQQLSATVTGTESTNSVTWRSEDESVATVSSRGLVTAKKTVG